MLPIFTPAIAFVLPLYVIWRAKGSRPLKNPFWMSIVSFLSCCGTCIVELVVIRRRAFAGDFAGIEDTINAVILICFFVIVVTVVLNFAALFIVYWKDRETE